MQKNHSWFCWFMIGFAAVGGILYGYDIGIIAGAILFIRETIPMTDAQSSILVGAVLGGGAIATLISGTLADFFGRRKMIIAAALIFLFGAFLLSFAHTYAGILIGRLTQGVGVGIVTIIIPLYLAESLPADVRGRGITAFQLLLTFGILVATLVGLYFTPTENWRGMFLSTAVPGFILLIGSLLLPNSPRWLFYKGRTDKALQVLLKSREHVHAQFELEKMHTLILQEKNNAKNLWAFLCNKQYLKPILLVMVIAAVSQIMGINSILQFSAYILKHGGLSANITAMLGSTVITSVNFLFTVIAFLLIDRIGRKFLLNMGTAGCTLSLLFLSCVYYFVPLSEIKGFLLLVGLVSFIIFFAVGPGVCIWLILSELLPARVRSSGMSIALFVNSMTSTLFASSFLPLVKHIGYDGVFLVCAIAGGIYYSLSYYFVPETKDKTLEEIEMGFASLSEHETRTAESLRSLAG